MRWKIASIGLAILGLITAASYLLTNSVSQKAEIRNALQGQDHAAGDALGAKDKSPAQFELTPNWNTGPVCDDCALNSCAPIEPPAPVYPSTLQPLEADCDVRFYLDKEGHPFDIQGECTDKAFVREAERAIAKMRWPVTDMDGETCPRIGQTNYPIKYPISFRFQR